MKFFRRKDKRKNDGDSGHGRMPGFGSSSYGNGKHSAPAHGGYGLGGPRPDAHRPFGSPPSALYDPGAYSQHVGFQPQPTRASAALLAHLPAAVFERIFVFVCPHSRDETYSTCEQSSVEDACMLCDLRDLSRCVAVCRRWKEEAVKQLYHSIRIDSVHYCELEAVLAERRKRRSFFDRNGQPEDPAQARLKLLCRTLREDPVRRGRLVEYLKMPYMLRESCQADLARTIAVTPNLHYVDLPEGLFTDDPAFLTLRLEVQARCLELRKMTYMGGSENSLQALATGKVWTKLEVLELIRIEMEPGMMRHVLGYLGNLRALKISQTTSFTDETLEWNDMLPPFPPVEEFILTDVPNVSCEGLKSWLMLPEARQALRVLTLNGTGARAWALQELMSYAPALKHLSLIDSVSATLTAAAGSHQIPPLSSTSLKSLHFEITAAPSTPKYSNVCASYYNYLAGSLLSGGLPNLHAVYVRDPNFPDLLLGLPPPAPAYAEGRAARPASSGSASPFSSPFGSPPGSPPNNSNRPPHGGLPPLQPPSAPFVGGGHRPHGSLSSLNNPFGAGAGAGPGTSPHNNPRFSSNNPFAALASSPGSMAGGFLNLPAKLEVFTKGEEDDQLGWSFVQVGGGGGAAASSSPGGGEGRRGRRGRDGSGGGGTAERPLSSYGLGADMLGGSTAGWSSGAGARRSVLISGVGGAGSGFLAVPGESPVGGGQSRGRREHNLSVSSLGEDEWPRPKSSAGEKKREKLDLWR
ncbi:hypothetical protein C7999DRAFT_38668 [Corynascus novoguineensis]|uniref:F-box domain-containing protein n=1 Tax=Corynascus novoguineensis TaxID=1126955 RepID=A0AAN7D0B2_9PEZI|nr:hypothetical protein C7999DRAFT_38668 [Corynascus novoguineensis]